MNCGVLGLDWRETSLSTYFEAMEAHAAANGPEAGQRQPASPEFRDHMQRVFNTDMERLRRFRRAHAAAT